MIPEMPALIPLQTSSHRLNRRAVMTQPPPPQVGSQITESDNDKRMDKQMLLVKRIRTLLGREMTKLQIMKKQLQLENINNIEILDQEKIREKRKEKGIVSSEMMMMKQQHQTEKVNGTESINLEIMKKLQFEKITINRMNVIMKNRNMKQGTSTVQTNLI